MSIRSFGVPGLKDRPRPLMLIAGDPIPTTGLTTKDADALAARLYAEISKTYYAHSDLTR